MKIVLVTMVCLGLVACSKNGTDPASLDPTDDGQVVNGYYYPGKAIWATASPESVGWNVAALQDVINFVASKNSTGFIIIYKGKIISENYWLGWSDTTTAEIESCSKTIAAFLIGIAQQKNMLNINTAVSSIYGNGWSKAPLAKERMITMKHLMTMTSGLNEDFTYVADAGSSWYYNTPVYQGSIKLLERVTGTDVNTYCKREIFDKIGMMRSVWVDGGSTRVSASCRDMARFGLLMLSNGRWANNVLLTDNNYFTEMTSTSQSLNNAYGYLTWLNGKSSYLLPTANPNMVSRGVGSLIPNAPDDMIMALGRGDKKIYVVKSKDLVVVRHGEAAGLSANALSSFDNQLWEKLKLVFP